MRRWTQGDSRLVFLTLVISAIIIGIMLVVARIDALEGRINARLEKLENKPDSYDGMRRLEDALTFECTDSKTPVCIWFNDVWQVQG